MKDSEDLLKKHNDDVTLTKNKLSSFVRKEHPSLTQRDFTDDIFAKDQLNKGLFVEQVPGFKSEGFTNVLVVMNKLKAEQILPEVYNCMLDYYTAIDAAEDARIDTDSSFRWNELKDKTNQLQDFLARHELHHPDELAARLDQETKDKLKALKKAGDATELQIKEFMSQREASKAEQMEAENAKFKVEAEAACKRDLLREHKKRRANRMPHVLVPQSGK